MPSKLVFLDYTSELASTRAGTPFYKAPEVLKSNPETKKIEYNNKVDVWSLGVCGYEMISFELPFKGEFDVCDVNINFNKLPEDNHPNLVPLVYKMLIRDVASRPTATELFEKMKELQQLQQQAGKLTL